MAKNINLMGAVFPDVPSVELPQEGGGLVSFDDTTDANAVASDIAENKTAYVNGVKLTGTKRDNNDFGEVIVGENSILAETPSDSFELVASNKINIEADATNKTITIGIDTLTKSDVGLGNVDNTSDANKSVLHADTADDADTVNGHTVASDVPTNAVFTDTTYNDATTSTHGLMSIVDKVKLDKLLFDVNDIIDASILPPSEDDVINAYPVSGATPLSSGWLSKTNGGTALTPESGKIYILLGASGEYVVNTQFRWDDVNLCYVRLSGGGGGGSDVLDNVIEAYARSGQTPLSSTWLATESASGIVITPTTNCVYILMEATDGYEQYAIFGWNGTAYFKISDGDDEDVIESYARTGETPLSSTWLSEESASGTALIPNVRQVYILMSATDGYNANTLFAWNGLNYVEISSGENEIDYEVDPIESVTFTGCGKNWYFRRVGNIVYLDAPDDATSASSGFNTIDTLPEGMRPKYDQRIGVGNGEGDTVNGFLFIATTGTVQYYSPNVLSSARNCSISTCYVAGNADRYVYPFCNLSISADEELYSAIDALDWTSEVIES